MLTYLALVRVLDLLSLSARCGVSPGALRDAIREHMDLFIQAYDSLGVRHKLHFAIHLPDMLERFGILIGRTIAHMHSNAF